jgi:2-methylisocitrate lyase-like PEP mutase family enzyme
MNIMQRMARRLALGTPELNRGRPPGRCSASDFGSWRLGGGSFDLDYDRGMVTGSTSTAAERLRERLGKPRLIVMPGCHDAMSARLIEEAGFEIGFMSGFAVSASRLAMPDTGLISYAELVDQGSNICRAVSIPMIGDGDTGFGSAQNIKRTVQGYARAGFACIMLEDQVAPKRCGHAEGKTVVGRDEALMRIRAAVDARDAGEDILIMARTDARVDSLDEAIARCRLFREIGADITLPTSPSSKRRRARQKCDATAQTSTARRWPT